MAGAAAVSMSMLMQKNMRYKKQVGPSAGNASLLMKPAKPSFQKWKEIVRHRQFVAAKQIIICVVLSGLVIAAIGVGITVFSFTNFQSYNAWRLIGPCVIACGLLVMLLCVELCVKRSKIGPMDMDEVGYLKGDTVQGDTHRYGFGNFNTETSEEEKASVVTPKRIEVKSESKDKVDEIQHTGTPDVAIIPASPYPPDPDESPSQENLELLLSPNSLD